MKERQAEFLNSLVGKWKGSVSTWFEPDKLADESEVVGQFALVGNGSFLRHTYQGSMQGKPRSGETTIVFNHVNNRYQLSWFDEFHMNYGLLSSEGLVLKNGFSVTGSYAVGPEHPDWGWETVYELQNSDQLIITAFNVTPNGEKAKAVETKYARQPE